MTDQALKDTIWITKKCRMNAEERYLKYDLVTKLLLPYYAFMVIAGNLIGIESPNQVSSLFSNITIIASVFVFGLSLIVSGFNFSKKADQYRECYRKIEKIDPTLTGNDLIKAYELAKEAYPNHSSFDYHDLVFKKKYFEKDPIRNMGDEEKKLTVLQISSLIIRKTSLYTFTALAFLLPLIFLFRIVLSNGS